jgi:hypothetical protein
MMRGGWCIEVGREQGGGKWMMKGRGGGQGPGGEGLGRRLRDEGEVVEDGRGGGWKWVDEKGRGGSEGYHTQCQALSELFLSLSGQNQPWGFEGRA